MNENGKGNGNGSDSADDNHGIEVGMIDIDIYTAEAAATAANASNEEVNEEEGKQNAPLLSRHLRSWPEDIDKDATGWGRTGMEQPDVFVHERNPEKGGFAEPGPFESNNNKEEEEEEDESYRRRKRK
jgi:hypothetical protein